MQRRITPQVGLRQIEEGHGRLEAILLEMDEGSSQLDETLVEGVVGCRLSTCQPEFLQDIMGLVELLPIEAVEKA